MRIKKPIKKVKRIIKNCSVKINRIDKLLSKLKFSNMKLSSLRSRQSGTKSPVKAVAEVKARRGRPSLAAIAATSKAKSPPQTIKSVANKKTESATAKKATPRRAPSPQPERLSKRTPKPNRRYINETTVNSAKIKTVESEDDESEDKEDEDEEPEETSDTEYEEEIKEVITKRASRSADKKPVEAPISKPAVKSASTGPKKTEQPVVVKKLVQNSTIPPTKRKIDYESGDDLNKSSPLMQKRKVLGKILSSSTPSLKRMVVEESDSDTSLLNNKAKSRKSDSPSLAKSAALAAKIKESRTVSMPVLSIQQQKQLQTAKDKKLVTPAAPSSISKTSSVKKSLTELLEQKKLAAQRERAAAAVVAEVTPVRTPTAATPKAFSAPNSNAKTTPATLVNKNKLNASAADLEDFEQMPTFTIVNINDIINQKEDVVVIEKNSSEAKVPTPTTKTTQAKAKVPTPTTKTTTAKTKRPPKLDDDDAGANIDDIMDNEYKPDGESSDDDFDYDSDLESKLNKSKASTRRKTQHTILSEKFKKQAAAAVTKASPQPPKILNIKLNQAANAKPYRNIIGNNKNNGKLSTEPPRILNSQLCKNTNNNLTPLIKTSPSKTITPAKNNNSPAKNNNSPNTLNRSKENVKSYAGNKNLKKGGGKQPVMPMPIMNSEEMHGDRRVRRITCFETWFVIKLPNIVDASPDTDKSICDLDLIKLGNYLPDLALPSDSWDFKVHLERIPPTKLDDDRDIYLGVVQDSDINPNDRHLYEPTNIMFRRANQESSLRMQYDRAVIFKNNTFFINVDGKNVKLLGAPSVISSFEDIEILLDIVDDINYESCFVEQSTYVI